MHANKCPMTAHRSQMLQGNVSIPGDKSISHRSLLLGSQAKGVTRITGLLEAEDVFATMHALQALGVNISSQGGVWCVEGVGIGGLKPAKDVLDMGNTGTGVRLLMGLVSTYAFATHFTGDSSLCKRPMGRVLEPLEQMGVSVVSSEKSGCLPLAIQAGSALRPISYELPVASAQVKSAILLAGLNIKGKTTVIEPHPTRDHTERMLRGMGAELMIEDDAKTKRRHITLTGKPNLIACDIHVPGDPSSAAFLAVAATITKGSEVVLRHVCINPYRIGLYETLREMGADIAFINPRQEAGEDVVDMVVKSSPLHGVVVPASRAASMIDEYPILAVAAATASGITVMEGLAELRVKESNRLDATLQGLLACGVDASVAGDTLSVQGGSVPGGATIETHMDHRMAMSFLVLGGISSAPITVDDISMIQTSFPEFITLMSTLGAVFK